MAKPKTARPPTSTPPPLGDAARDAAFHALARQARAYPDLAPDALQYQFDARAVADPGLLRPLDRAFAHAIYNASVARWLTLAWLLDREITQGFDALEPRLKAVLLGGAAQLMFIDRVPAHAAINHAVEWAKQTIRPGAGGLVNAVLRRIATLRAAAAVEQGPWSGDPTTLPLSDGRVLRGDGLALPDDELDRLAIATSHPRPLLDHWRVYLDPARVRTLALHDLIEPPVILNIEHAADQLATADRTATTPHDDPHHAVLSDPAASLGDLLGGSPGIWVQDPSAAGAIRSIADLDPPPRVIIDLCAGRGTKTRQLAAAFPNAEIIATDIEPVRLHSLSALFKNSAQVSVLKYELARDRALQRADLVVLDVPCTNTGVLPRRPEARYRFGPASLESLAGVQRQILADSIPLLTTERRTPRRVLYSTCSLEPAENTAQAHWMGHWHKFRPTRERAVLPAGLPGEAPCGYRDGAFSVLLIAP